MYILKSLCYQWFGRPPFNCFFNRLWHTSSCTAGKEQDRPFWMTERHSNMCLWVAGRVTTAKYSGICGSQQDSIKDISHCLFHRWMFTWSWLLENTSQSQQAQIPSLPSDLIREWLAHSLSSCVGGGLLCKLERAVIKYFLKINLKFYENSSLECRLSPVMYVG